MYRGSSFVPAEETSWCCKDGCKALNSWRARSCCVSRQIASKAEAALARHWRLSRLWSARLMLPSNTLCITFPLKSMHPKPSLNHSPFLHESLIDSPGHEGGAWKINTNPILSASIPSRSKFLTNREMIISDKWKWIYKLAQYNECCMP